MSATNVAATDKQVRISLRASRPYQPNEVLDCQKALLARGEILTCLSVAATLVADIVAMIRYPSLWIGFPAGYILVALVVGIALFTILVGWLVSHSTRQNSSPSLQGAWIRAIGISLVEILILALYPANWRESIPGALFTVVVGM